MAGKYKESIDMSLNVLATCLKMKVFPKKETAMTSISSHTHKSVNAMHTICGQKGQVEATRTNSNA